jgi:hypothetical protein
MRHPSAFVADCHLTDGPTRELELGTHLAQPLTSGFSCTKAERVQVQAVLGHMVTAAELRRAVGTAVAQAQRDAMTASRALRARPRSVRTSRIFRSIFNVPPTFVPAWHPGNASWRDLGELVALRIENGSRILGGGYMHFFCWGSTARCPECAEPPASYRACSSYQGRHHICLGREWWQWYRDGHRGFMASTLLHEAMHIYFRLEHHKATVGRPSVNNMYCYDTLVAIFSGRTPKPGDRDKCASKDIGGRAGESVPVSQKVGGLEAEDHHTAGYELELEDYDSLVEDHELLELLPVGDGGAVPWREEDAYTSEAPTPDALQARVAEVIASGVRDENKLTDVAFTITHPDIGSRKLQPDDERDKPLIHDWLRIRDELVRPALRRHRMANGPAAPETPSADPAAGAIAERFLAENRDALRQFPWRDDAEMRLLVEAIVHGFREVIFDADNVTEISRQRLGRLKLPVTAASGLPLIHTVFMNRHPGRVLAGKCPLYESYKRTDRKGEFYDLRPLRKENPLLTEGDWDELHSISELVYQALRYVLPRITPRPIVSERDSLGQKIAARAHCYLGVRYALGPWRYEPDPEYSKLRPNTLDCAALLRDGHGTLDCSALVQYVYADILGRLLKYRKHCPTGVMCIYDGGDFDDLGSPTSGVIPRVGDLLLAGAEKKWHHVGIYVGGDQLIDAWYTGTVVRKRDYVPKHWARVLRFKGEGAGGP